MQANKPSLISWREWDQEAFALARSLDVPILLSISAVWCHWCHVMDQTTFADPEVAAQENGLISQALSHSNDRPETKEKHVRL